MPIDKATAQWYGLPSDTNYFIASKNGGLASNIKTAPDGTVFQFSDTRGLEGSSGFFKKQGNQMVPINQQEAHRTGNIERVDAPVSYVNNIGMGISPPSQDHQFVVESPFANIQLQTGDPALDEFLNGPFLQAVRDQLGGDPLAIYRALNDPAVLKQAIDRAGEAYGETFKLARDRVERNFQIQQGEVDLRRREQIGEIAQNLERQGVERTRAIEDATNIVNQAQQQFGLTESDIDLRRREQIADIESQTGQLGVERTRTEEDLGEGRTRIARNMQNAIQESAAAFASAGRAFGEGRVEAERKISEKSSERLADIEKQAKRSLENIQKQEQDLQKQRGFGEEQFGLAGREAQMGLERTQQQARLGQERSLQDITRQESALSAQRGFVGEQAGLAERRLGLGREEDLGELTGQERALGLGEVQLLRDLAGNLLKNPEYTGR